MLRLRSNLPGLLALPLFFGVAGCATSLPTNRPLTQAELEIQQARGLSGFNANNFLPGPTSEKPPLLKGPADIAAALRRGGYIVYMRHGRTQYEQIALERDHRTKGTFDLDNCSTQRALSKEGRASMQLSGAAFRALDIPVEKAFSSRYCRAIDSAAYFVNEAQTTNALSGEGQVGKDPAQKARTIQFFSQVPAPGKNIFMMAHGGIFWEATGFVIQEEHAVVLDPKDLSTLVARIAPEQWQALRNDKQP